MTATTRDARRPASGEATVESLRLGTERHKEAFCRMLLDSHDPYRPAVIPWPSIGEDALARLTGLPFWDIAVETEGHAAARIARMAERERDPLIKEALCLMAFEEQRHKDVLSHMIRFYGIPLGAEQSYAPPPQVEWYFMRTGAGECLDSFFAFGLFELAKRSGFFPEDLVEVFEPVIQEEARHILFYVNWLAYSRRRRPPPARAAFALRRIGTLLAAGRARLSLGRSMESDNFTSSSQGAIAVEVSARGFLELCLSENERRMARLDPRLPRPWLMPMLAKAALPFLPRR